MPDPSQVGVGDRIQVTVTVDTSVPLNTYAGTLTYDPSLRVVAVSDANSVATMWLTRPVAGPSIPFIGFTAGGYAGKGGTVFKVIFEATKPGTARVALSDTQLLRNDGAGTNETVNAPALTLSVASAPQGSYSEVPDNVAPEPFAPILGSDPALYDGRYYAAFETQDKGSGIDRYAVSETRLFDSASVATTSPYLIRDQYLTSDVIVRAYDRAGNMRVAVLHRQHLLRPYEKVLASLILIGVLLWGIIHYAKRRAH
jgi:hypothetical protein